MKAVLFVRVHNAGRSQMAEAFVNRLAAERGVAIRAISAGTLAGTRINSDAAAAMREIGISVGDMSSMHRTGLSPETYHLSRFDIAARRVEELG